MPVLRRQPALGSVIRGDHIKAKSQGHGQTVPLHIEIFVFGQGQVAEHTSQDLVKGRCQPDWGPAGSKGRTGQINGSLGRIRRRVTNMAAFKAVASSP